MKEVWKDIPGYEGLYQVSDLGSVKSLEKHKWSVVNNSISIYKEKNLKPGLNANGYLIVVLYLNRVAKAKDVHQLVAMAFLNHIPNGHVLVVDHINNIKTDNRALNLQLITHRKNTSKDKKNGTSKYIGVYWNKRVNKWHSQISIKGKLKHLGYFTDELKASTAYQKSLNKINNGKPSD